MQVMEAVQNAVQNGIEQLSQSQVSANNMPIASSGDYMFQARTREELIATTQQAAESRAIDPRARFAQLHDPARAIPGTPEIDVSEIEMRSPSGLVLPSAGKTPQAPKPPQGPKARPSPQGPQPATPPKPPATPQGWLM